MGTSAAPACPMGSRSMGSRSPRIPATPRVLAIDRGGVSCQFYGAQRQKLPFSPGYTSSSAASASALVARTVPAGWFGGGKIVYNLHCAVFEVLMTL